MSTLAFTIEERVSTMEATASNVVADESASTIFYFAAVRKVSSTAPDVTISLTF
jgi:hypothetical protein